MGWTWDYVENAVTYPRLEAINASFEVVPPSYIMTAFVAFARGYKLPPKPEEIHPGASLIMMAPDGFFKFRN